MTGVSVSPTSLNLIEGETATISATVKPDNAGYKSVSWSSSDAETVAVDNDGKVTAIKAGTTDVTASADGVSSEPCEVTVKEIQGLAIPDPALQAYLLSIGDSNKDGKLTSEEAGKIRTVQIPSTVKDLSGLEQLENLETFTYLDGDLDIIELSGYNKMSIATIYNSQKLILSDLPLLRALSCHAIGDSDIHVSDCPNIEDMTVRSPTLKSLDSFDLKNLSKLRKLRLEIQEVETVELGEKPVLDELWILRFNSSSVNKIKSLDVSGCPALTLPSATIDYTTSLDLSKNTKLRTCDISSIRGMRSLDCSALSQDIERLEFHGHAEDLAEVSNLYHLTNLQHLYLDNPSNAELDLSGNLKFVSVWIGSTYSETVLPLKTVYLKQNQTISTMQLPDGVSIQYKE